MDRAGLAEFLRLRRESLQPADVGIDPGRRRRTPGLRREEVADLAAMSTDFYARLEQARGSRPSEQTVAAVATALRVTPDERDHMYRLAGYNPPARAFRTDHVTPSLLRVLGQLDTPAQVVSDLGVTLVQNQLAVALLGDQLRGHGLARNSIYRWFTDEATRSRVPRDDWEFHGRNYVATVRAAHGRAPDDPQAAALVDALLAESAEFAELWARHEVRYKMETRKRIVHPTIGVITLDCQVLTAETLTERLIVFTAIPGTEDANRLALLGVVGTQELGSSAQQRR
ncbi:MAG: helix-turn-helix transcriptional regulator [Patulibacter minatonensis]